MNTEQYSHPQRNELFRSQSGRVIIVDSVEPNINMASGYWVKYHQVEPATDIEEMAQTILPLDRFLSVYTPATMPPLQDDYDG